MIWIEFRCEINWWLPTSIQSSFHIAFLSHNVLFVLPILMQYMYGVVRELIRLNRIGALISSAICAQLLIAALHHKCWQHHKHGFDINDLSNDLIRAQWYKLIFGMDLHLNTIFPNPCYRFVLCHALLGIGTGQFYSCILPDHLWILGFIMHIPVIPSVIFIIIYIVQQYFWIISLHKCHSCSIFFCHESLTLSRNDCFNHIP